jgi:hypothetical protein
MFKTQAQNEHHETYVTEQNIELSDRKILRVEHTLISFSPQLLLFLSAEQVLLL